MAIRYYRNGAATSLAVPVDNISTTITVASITGFPVQFPYTLILDPDTVLEEVVDAVSAIGSTITIVRGVDSTTSSAHSAGAVVYHGVSARDHAEANTHVNGTSNVHGSTGALVDTGSDQTVSGNKTFTGTLQTAGGPVVAIGGTQTVTGAKTFTGGLSTAGGVVVVVGGAQTVTGAKTFTGGLLTPGGAVVDLGSTQVITGNKTFGGPTANTGNEVHGGTEVHNGTETHNNTETHNGAVTFAGAAVVGGTDLAAGWVAYTPTRKNGPTGAALNTGTGALTGRYKIIGGKTCLFRISFVFGTTSDFGAGFWAFTLPFSASGTTWCGTAFVFDASASKEFSKGWRTVTGQDIVVVAESGDRISNTSPLVWAVGDEVFMSGSYELP
jgi:hypothetical protein